MIRRSFIKIGGDLAVDFANTAAPEGDRGSGLDSWRDLIDFLELRDAVSREVGARLRAGGAGRACLRGRLRAGPGAPGHRPRAAGSPGGPAPAAGRVGRGGEPGARLGHWREPSRPAGAGLATRLRLDHG